jgi:hypothetical protein
LLWRPEWLSVVASTIVLCGAKEEDEDGDGRRRRDLVLQCFSGWRRASGQGPFAVSGKLVEFGLRAAKSSTEEGVSLCFVEARGKARSGVVWCGVVWQQQG